MTVLHVVPARPFGGMQRIAALLAAAQRRSGLDAHVLAIYDSVEFLDLLERYDVPHIFLHGSCPNFRAVRHCHEALARDWSVVHVHGGLLWSNTVALFTKRSPVVYHAHNYPPLDRSLKTRVLNRVNRSLVDVIIAVSKDVARAWRVAGLDSAVECVYNAVELPNVAKPDRLPRSTDSPVFGMATRLAKDKGVFEFLDVAEAIHAQRSGARFVIAGKGPERSKLEEETNRRGLSGVFFFPGYIRDLDAFWSDIDIALFTAAKEPFGLRILEAMVRGVPVAAYLTGAGSDDTKLMFPQQFCKNSSTLFITPAMWLPWIRWCFKRSRYVELTSGGRLAGFETFGEFWEAHGMMPTKKERLFMERLVLPSGVVFDIGANSGAFCITMAKIQPSGAIHAFQPSPRTFERLLTNVRANDVERTIECHECAVARSTGRMSFFANPASSGTNRLLPHGYAERNNVVEVRTVSFDDFVSDSGIQSVDFTKIDVEGFECEVLWGAARVLRERILAVGLIELCPANLQLAGASVEDLFQMVREVGWTLRWITPSGDIGDQIALDDARTVVLENVALVPKDGADLE